MSNFEVSKTLDKMPKFLSKPSTFRKVIFQVEYPKYSLISNFRSIIEAFPWWPTTCH